MRSHGSLWALFAIACGLMAGVVVYAVLSFSVGGGAATSAGIAVMAAVALLVFAT